MAGRTVRGPELDGGVAVGVDGSAASLRALLLAAEEAVQRNVVLHVVRAWSMRTAPRPADCPTGAVPSMEAFEQAVREETAEFVDRKLGPDPGVAVQLHIVHSPAPQALLTASQGAELLVVGHRGHGGFAGLKLGSVADHCARHASCPVLVARPRG